MTMIHVQQQDNRLPQRNLKFLTLIFAKMVYFLVWFFGIFKKLNFWSKIESLVKNRNFGQKSKLWSNIEILVKNRNFGQRSKFWSKIELFFIKNSIFDQKSKLWSKLEILITNQNFDQKSKPWTKSKFWPTFEIFGSKNFQMLTFFLLKLGFFSKFQEKTAFAQFLLGLVILWSFIMMVSIKLFTICK